MNKFQGDDGVWIEGCIKLEVHYPFGNVKGARVLALYVFMAREIDHIPLGGRAVYPTANKVVIDIIRGRRRIIHFIVIVMNESLQLGSDVTVIY